jgi:hypothetical protein
MKMAYASRSVFAAVVLLSTLAACAKPNDFEVPDGGGAGAGGSGGAAGGGASGGGGGGGAAGADGSGGAAGAGPQDGPASDRTGGSSSIADASPAAPDGARGPDVATPPTPLPSDRPNYVFVTSATYVPGELGSVAAGDRACNTLARAANLPGTYVAYLGTRAEPFTTRLGNARGWVRPDGKPFMDQFRSDYATSVVFYPPELDERGMAVPDMPPAAGSPESGDCEAFTSTAPACGPRYGVPSSGNGGWNGFGGCVRCSARVRLYCLGKDTSYTVQVMRMAGRQAFLTDQKWLPGGGIAAADALCQREAQAASLSGSFKALLATAQATAASRFNATTGQPWVRLDGVPLVSKPTDLFATDGKALVPLQLTSKSQYIAGEGVWSGAPDPQAPGTPASTCASWTTTTGTAQAGAPEHSRLTSMFGDWPDEACNQPHRLYCLQE